MYHPTTIALAASGTVTADDLTAAVHVSAGTDADIIATAHGTGTYDGVTEPCTVVLAIVPAATLRELRSSLRTLAYRHGEESIGCIVHDRSRGESLVYGRDSWQAAGR